MKLRITSGEDTQSRKKKKKRSKGWRREAEDAKSFVRTKGGFREKISPCHQRTGGYNLRFRAARTGKKRKRKRRKLEILQKGGGSGHLITQIEHVLMLWPHKKKGGLEICSGEGEER